MFKFKKKLLQHQQGFTLVEVLAAIVIATLFVGVTMQAMVMAAYLKSRALESTEAMGWIHKNLEEIKYKASIYVETTRCGTTATPATITTGYADGLRDDITSVQSGTSNYVDFQKNSRTGKQYTLRRTTTLGSVAPYNVLQISYTVTPATGGNAVATNYTEVMPDAALLCP